jgi:hypothetical protein
MDRIQDRPKHIDRLEQTMNEDLAQLDLPQVARWFLEEAQ